MADPLDLAGEPAQPAPRGLLPAVLAAAALLALLLGLAPRRAADEAASATGPRAAAANVFRWPGEGPVPVPVTRATGLAAGAAGTPALKPGEVELCGVGPVPDEGLAATGNGRHAWERKALVAAYATLAAQPDERLRAAGLLLQSRTAGLLDERPPQDTGVAPECAAADAACSALPRLSAADNILVAMREAGAPAANALARQALFSADPLVYAMAWEACRPNAGGAPDSDCARLSAEQWARLAPDNAAPWFAVAEAAHDRHDDAAEAEAYYRASVAPASRSMWSVLPALAGRGLASAPPWARALVVPQAWSVQGPWSLPSYVGVMRHCDAAALRDANRRQTCEALAALLVERSNVAIEYRLGLRLGERLGWPAERLAALRGESDRLMHAASELQFSDLWASFSCRAAQQLRDWTELTLAYGEYGAMRERLRREAAGALGRAAERGRLPP